MGNYRERIVFCGDFTQNNGPANVNKKIRENLNCIFIDTKNKNKLKVLLLFIKSLFLGKVYIFSSIYRVNYYFFKFAKILNKKIIYLMHGCCCLDAKINKKKNADMFMKMEKKLFDSVDLILTVSETYINNIVDIYPEYASKITFLTNGIDVNDYIFVSCNNKKRNNTLAVCGGNRIIKCNSNVVNAINNHNNSNKDKFSLDIYGDFYNNNELISENKYVKIHGNVAQKNLFSDLSKTKLFVLNSKYESFGLSVIDALMCGCNVLVSKNAGINDIINFKDSDIINNYDDVEEIQKKIEYNMLNDNNKRLIDSIDFDYYSWSNVSKRLEKFAEELDMNNK